MVTDIACHGDLHGDVELAINDFEVPASGAGHCYGLVLGAVLVEHEKAAVGEFLSVHHIVLEPFTERFHRLVGKGSFKGHGRDPGSSLDIWYVGGSENERPYGSFFWLLKEPVDVVVRALKGEINGL